jgi:hypothetical protein
MIQQGFSTMAGTLPLFCACFSSGRLFDWGQSNGNLKIER